MAEDGSAPKKAKGMQLKMVKTLWGMDEAADTAKWDSMLASIKAKGYAGCEVAFPSIEAIALGWRADTDLLVELLNKHGLALVCQLHTAGGDLKDGNYIYCSSGKLEDHKRSFSDLVAEVTPIIARVKNGGFINSHSGCDSFRLEEAVQFVLHALKVEEEHKIKITHETHRQRLFWNPFITQDMLTHPSLKGKAVKLNAVCERVFDAANDPRDQWWTDFFELLSAHVEFCHCRCGWAEGPQISDPSAPEWKTELALHTGWWTRLWKAQQRRGNEECWIEPEYGPPPYLPCLPHSGAPVADLEKVVEAAKKQLEEAFQEAITAPSH